MYGQTVIHYKAVIPTVFPATTVIKAIKVITATTAIIIIIVIITIITTGLLTNAPTVVTFVIISLITVSISSRKPLKNKPTDNMIWYLRCGHPSKETFKSMIK